MKREALPALKNALAVLATFFGGALIGATATFGNNWRAAGLCVLVGLSVAWFGLVTLGRRMGRLFELEQILAQVTPYLNLMESGRYVHVEKATARLDQIFVAHLSSNTDPCADHGRRWPCDVVLALREFGQTLREPIISDDGGQER